MSRRVVSGSEIPSVKPTTCGDRSITTGNQIVIWFCCFCVCWCGLCRRRHCLSVCLSVCGIRTLCLLYWGCGRTL